MTFAPSRGSAGQPERGGNAVTLELRGRPMPRDRLTRRALVVSTTVVLLAVSTGCLRSSFLRPAAEPITEPSSPISPGPVVRPVPAASSGQPSAPLPTPAPQSPSTSSPAIVVPPPLPVTSPNQNPSYDCPDRALDTSRVACTASRGLDIAGGRDTAGGGHFHPLARCRPRARRGHQSPGGRFARFERHARQAGRQKSRQ